MSKIFPKQDPVMTTGGFSRNEERGQKAHPKKRPGLGQQTDLLSGRPADWTDESALIFATQHGDLDSFNNLVLVYQDSLFNTAARILNDQELAADATQNAFLSAFRNINSYRGGSFKAWLMRTVINACYDELRRQKRRPTVALDLTLQDDEETESAGWLADKGLSPEEEFDAAELEHAIQHCLDALPTNFRTAVVLVDIQEMNYREAASAICVPLGTIKSRLARARLRLRHDLQNFCELLPVSFRLEQKGPPLFSEWNLWSRETDHHKSR
jgi:RNA polymerase sigma factor (sigma-70 family)